MIQQILLEILKYSLPSAVIAGIVYLFLRHFEKIEKQKLNRQVLQQREKETTPIKIQAYERIVLLLDRITPSNLIMRLRTPDMNAGDLHQLLVFSIRQEYEHNIAQQLYLGANTWQMVTLTKDQIIHDINLIYSQTNREASASEFSRAILQFYIEKNEPMPTQRCIDIVKTEFNSIFG